MTSALVFSARASCLVDYALRRKRESTPTNWSAWPTRNYVPATIPSRRILLEGAMESEESCGPTTRPRAFDQREDPESSAPSESFSRNPFRVAPKSWIATSPKTPQQALGPSAQQRRDLLVAPRNSSPSFSAFPRPSELSFSHPPHCDVWLFRLGLAGAASCVLRDVFDFQRGG